MLKNKKLIFLNCNFIDISDLTTGLSLPYYNKVIDYVKTGEDLYQNLQDLK